LILGIETATRAGSVALVRATAGSAGAPSLGSADAPSFEALAESRFGETGASASEILPALDGCIARIGARSSEIELIAVSVGPGSFTGLRVGLATAQGLALGLGAPLAGVGTLEALAAAAIADGGPIGADDVLCACLDARRGEVYAALYRSSESWPGVERLTEEAAYAPAELIVCLRSAIASTRGVGELVFVGDGAERHHGEIVAPVTAAAKRVSFRATAPRAAIVAQLGYERFRNHGPDAPAALVPRYTRASEAEIKRQQRLAGAQAGSGDQR
jgi:tRNA threonylcarbamoyladenosine biosynthesis protein TsaB